MAKVTLEVSTDVIKELLAQFPPAELRVIFENLQERLETIQMMRLAEAAFAEWSQEEDLYSHG